MTQLTFISDGRIHILDPTANSTRPLNCLVADTYREREREIRLKKEWKQRGTGAMFTGAYMPDAPSLDIRLPITGLAQSPDQRLIYSINFESGGGIYFKHPSPDQPEPPIIASASTHYYELDINPSGRIAVSCAENYLERHIALLSTNDSYVQTVTEGECTDSNPTWSRKDENILYYDSAGIGYGPGGQFSGYGPRSIYRLNIKTHELDEVVQGGAYEYSHPFEDADGNLYYIRRPYKQASGRMSLLDVVTAPFKILRAIGAWLDFFSRRYTGTALNTSGANPAKANTKSPHQVFVDNNMFEADKAIKENAKAGDKHPGYVPQNWELIVKKPSGEETVLHKSVMSYTVTPDGIAYSNGKYVMLGGKAFEAELASMVTPYA